MKNNSKAVGERTEGIILARLLRLGFSVLMPFGNNQRYDMVVDKGDGTFIKGQCKTARMYRECVRFNTASVNGFTGKRTTYHGQVDVFWVYCPDTDLVYEIPVSVAGKSECAMRVHGDSRRSGPKTRWAKDFIL